MKTFTFLLLVFLWIGEAASCDRLRYLPVQHEGRVKPLDTVARNSLLLIHGSQSLKHDGKQVSPIEWLADVMMNASSAKSIKLFRVENHNMLAFLGKTTLERTYYSLDELEPHFNEIYNLFSQALQIAENQRNPYQRASILLWQQIATYLSLSHSLWMPESENILQELKYLSNLSSTEKEIFQSRYHFLSQSALFQVLYPWDQSFRWKNIGDGLLDYIQEGKTHPEIPAMAHMIAAYQQKDFESFNKIIDSYFESFKNNFPGLGMRMELEVLYNTLQPFYIGIIIYLSAFLLALIPVKFLKNIPIWVLSLGFIFHTFGIIARMLIEKRPPVTNLYSSAVFVGWAIVLFSLILEKIYRNHAGCISGALAGTLSLIVAHNLTGSTDTMEVMRAVLDSNFWLSTHVIFITLGYSATLLAGTLASWSIIRRLFTNESIDPMGKMVYSIVSLSALLTFTGTVLGGIWADQSWGRFWGWDPKENGALLIILWDAIILHARLGGMIKTRGLMAMAVFGNIVTAFSWFGVNMLGVGLHSYGFMDEAFFYLGLFIASQIVIIILGLLSRKTIFVHSHR